MKVIPLLISQNHQNKINLIKKYGSSKDFWFDFTDSRPYVDDDKFNYLLPIYEKSQLVLIKDHKINSMLLYNRALWDKSAKTLGSDATPVDIILYIINFFVLRILQRKEYSRKWVAIANFLFDTFFTSYRINKFKKPKILKV